MASSNRVFRPVGQLQTLDMSLELLHVIRIALIIRFVHIIQQGIGLLGAHSGRYVEAFGEGPPLTLAVFLDLPVDQALEYGRVHCKPLPHETESFDLMFAIWLDTFIEHRN